MNKILNTKKNTHRETQSWYIIFIFYSAMLHVECINNPQSLIIHLNTQFGHKIKDAAFEPKEAGL